MPTQALGIFYPYYQDTWNLAFSQYLRLLYLKYAADGLNSDDKLPINNKENNNLGALIMINKPKKKKHSRHVSKTVEIAKAVLLVIIIGTVLRIFVVNPYRISGIEMQNGLYPGDFLLASKLSYKFEEPEVGDLVLIHHPLRIGEKLVSRIVAVAGQTVEISGKQVFVNGEPFHESATAQHSDYRVFPTAFSNRDYMAPQQVPPGHIFVLGDNRDQSEDSRNFGFVSKSNIIGKGLFVYFSWAPDPAAPKLKSPYILPALHLFFYNLYSFPSRVRWDRFFV
jgi:signal peptidase I